MVSLLDLVSAEGTVVIGEENRLALEEGDGGVHSFSVMIFGWTPSVTRISLVLKEATVELVKVEKSVDFPSMDVQNITCASLKRCRQGCCATCQQDAGEGELDGEFARHAARGA